ncbi:MAG: hypothetical protein L0Z53_10860 [Acidobacteriales bacterium]|nr:hypothetical protein [Terriglobales bacterium]
MIVPIECGEGWASLYLPLIERCRADGVSVLQIKEKFGGLRFYVGPASDELYAAIDMAEAASLTMCEECGASGKRRGGSWIRTLCDMHAERDQHARRQNISVPT